MGGARDCRIFNQDPFRSIIPGHDPFVSVNMSIDENFTVVINICFEPYPSTGNILTLYLFGYGEFDAVPGKSETYGMSFLDVCVLFLT